MAFTENLFFILSVFRQIRAVHTRLRMKQLKFSKKYELVRADKFFRLTSKHSSAPAIGIDHLRSPKEWRAVASNSAIEESDKAIANIQLYRRYLDEMENTRRKPVSEHFGFDNPKHQQ